MKHLEPMLVPVLRVQEYRLVTFEPWEAAREMLGIALPSFEAMLEFPPEPEVFALEEKPIAVGPLLAGPLEAVLGEQLELGSDPSAPLRGRQLLENARMLLSQAWQLQRSQVLPR